jgi:RHS repeat-associated protein
MKSVKQAVVALVLGSAALVAQAAAQFSEKDYTLYAGDFNGDGRADLLYVGKTPDKPNGIALADSSGAPQVGFQSWPATYLGIPWSTGQFVPAIGDFNGDGKSDILMQSATAGTSYVLLANTNTALGDVGQIVGINQGIAQTDLGTLWSADQHKILVGDFDGDAKDDVLLQATAKGGTNAIVLTDSGGNLFTRSGAAIGCSAAGPQQCWTDGEQGLAWSTKGAVLAVGKFNADARADILYLARPNIVLIDYDIAIPVPVFKPNTFGVFLSQMTGPTVKVLNTANQLWSKSDLGAQWSPLNLNVFAGDFNGDGYADVLLQSKGGSNLIAYGASNGVLGTAVAPASNVAGWNGNAYTAVVGKFGNSSSATLYLQAKDGSGTNYYTSNISAGSVTAYASALQIRATLPTVATAIGATPASADVTQNGSAAYTIPIQLPKGTAGLTPELSLTYSSGGGNGLVGVGWNITGLGIIARCPRTIAQDGVTQGVQLLSTDQYCLNGNRLRLVGGTQGAAGSTYRTELETFALVTANGSGTQGPLSFTVKTKDGLIYEYGSTTSANSRIGVSPPGNTAITRVWALSKVSDRATSATAGNFWTVTYINDAAGTGSYRPDYIDYTTNAVAVPVTAPYRVKFYYQARNAGENVVSYYMGGLINQTQRLERVELQSSGGAAMIRKYTLAYEVPASAFNVVSRLASLQECSPTACMAATTFTWSDTSMSGASPALGGAVEDLGFVSGGSNGSAVSAMNADINGDGISDIVTLTSIATPSPPYQICTATLQIGVRNGQTPSAPQGIAGVVCAGYIGVIDLDGDGKDDLLFNGSNWIHQKTDGSYVFEAHASASVGSIFSATLVDVDGDGFKDVVGYVYGDQTHLYVRFHKRDGASGLETTDSLAWTASAGTSMLSASYPWWMNTGAVRSTLTAADFDGDGQQDLMVHMTDGWRILYSNGSGFVNGDLIVPYSTGAGASINYATPVALDVNGDGCTDVAYAKTVVSTQVWFLAKAVCRVTSGVGLATAINTGVGVNFYLGNVVGSAVDWNADGNQDLLSANVILQSDGVTFSAYAGWTGSNVSNLWLDRDGDGVLDFVTPCISGCSTVGAYTRQSGVGMRANNLVSAVDGFGKQVQIAYAPLTDPAVYTRGTIGIGKTQDTQSSMYVVRRLTLTDGVGGTYSQAYAYSEARRNVAGRGFLGFKVREATDSRTSFVTREDYNASVFNDHSQWEFVGTLAGKTVYQYKSGASYGPKVEELTQSWFSIAPTGNATGKYPYVAISVAKRYELGGVNSPITTSTTSLAGVNGAAGIDGYGTVYDVTTTTVEGISGLSPGASSTVRRYTPVANILNDTTNWCIARPLRVEDIRSHSMTGGTSLTRVSTQAWNAAQCRVTNTVAEPGSGALQLYTLIEYDSFNNVNKTTVSATGVTTRISQANFGTNGHLQQSATNAKGHVATFTWNVNLGFQTGMTDPNGLVTTFVPDDFGREKEMIRPDGTRTFKSYYNCTSANSYCGDGLLRYVVHTEERNAANDAVNLINYSDQFVDMMGRVKYVQSRGFGGQTTATETLYDSRGNVVLKTNPYYAGTGSVSGVPMSYDSLNRLTQTQRPLSDSDRTVVSEFVTYEGLKIRSFDANGRETSKTSNVVGTVSQAVDEAGKITSYTYNSFGELLSATDPALNATAIVYNVRGFKSSSIDPDMGSWSYTYDALGQMLTQTDAKAQTTTFTYDVLGRTATRVDHGGGAANTTTWTWDGPGGVATAFGIGQLKTVTAPGSYSETYAYDNKGRRSQLSTLASATTYVMDYAYDSNIGALKTVTYPSSTGGTRVAVEYSYQNGFLKDAKDVSAGMAVIWQANAQDARGHVTQEQFGNGQIANLGFDQTNGRLYTVQTGTSAATQNLTYAWDAIGNLTSRRDNAQSISESFTYDLVYRLTGVQRNGTMTQTVTYDDIGNITSKSDVGGAYVYTGAQAGCTYTGLTPQPHAVRKVGTTVYCYDKNGNMTSRGGAAVTWSTFNYPLTINQTGGNSSTFLYGADRNRYRQVSIDGVETETRTTIAGGAFEKNVRTGGTDPGTEYRHYVMAGAKAVALITRAAANATPTVGTYAETYYLHADHLGSTDVITKSGGVVHVRTSFDAWGQRRGSAWTGTPSVADKAAITRSTRKGYTGHEQLDNLNLVHMNGRVYDPTIARFLSADPIVQDPYHSQAFNRYSYVWNNPLNATDPTGFVSCTGSRLQFDYCSDGMGNVTAVDNQRLEDKGIGAGQKLDGTYVLFRIDAGNNSVQSTTDTVDRERTKALENQAGRNEYGFAADSVNNGYQWTDAEPEGLGKLREGSKEWQRLETDLWKKSHSLWPFVRDREHGMMVYRNKKGDLRFETWKAGRDRYAAQGNMNIPKGFALIATFHTHPTPYGCGNALCLSAGPSSGRAQDPKDPMRPNDDRDMAEMYPNAYHYIWSDGPVTDPWTMERWYYGTKVK